MITLPRSYHSKVQSGITAREPQQNTVIVFSITLTQKRVRPPVWIILVLHAELASVRALLVKAFTTPTSHPLLNLYAMCLSCCMHTHKQKSENANENSHDHISTSRARAHTHTHTHANMPSHDRASAPAVPPAPRRAVPSLGMTYLMSSGFYSRNGRWPDPKSSRLKGGRWLLPRL